MAGLFLIDWLISSNFALAKRMSDWREEQYLPTAIGISTLQFVLSIWVAGVFLFPKITSYAEWLNFLIFLILSLGMARYLMGFLLTAYLRRPRVKKPKDPVGPDFQAVLPALLTSFIFFVSFLMAFFWKASGISIFEFLAGIR